MKNFALTLFSLLLTSICVQITFSQQEKSKEIRVLDTPTPVKQSSEIDFGDYLYITAEDIKSFIDRLNNAGKRGYKLQHITKTPLEASEEFYRMILTAIVKLDAGNTYEYDWFESLTPGETVTRINLRAKNGFYYHDNLAFSQGACGGIDRYSPEKSDEEKTFDKIMGWLSFADGHIFFLERKNGVVEKNEYQVVTGNLGWGKKPTAELERDLKSVIEIGFHPVAMGSYKVLNNYAFMVLVERDIEFKEELVDSKKTEFKFLKSEFNFQKKINNLAEQGFRINFSGEFGALNYALLTKQTDSKELIYKWFDATDDDFAKKLSKNSNQNLSYQKIGFKHLGCDSVEGEMLFEQDKLNKSRKYQYKMLKLDDESEVLDKNELPPRLVLPSEKKIKEFKAILSEGYIIRDLFYSNGINVLFERQ